MTATADAKNTNGHSHTEEVIAAATPILQVQEYITEAGIVMPKTIIKRTGQTVPFDRSRIENAIQKCFDSFGRVPEVTVALLATQVVNIVAAKYPAPTVENVQDTVEMVLQAAGEFEAAKRYILYRQQRAEMRDLAASAGISAKVETAPFLVVKRDGSKEAFQEKKLEAFMRSAVEGFEDTVDLTSLVRLAVASIYDGISSQEIARLGYLTTKSFIEKNSIYDRVTVRLFLTTLYKEVIGKKYRQEELVKVYQQAFVDNLKFAVEIGKVTPEVLEFDLDLLSRHLDMEKDSLFTYRGLQTLYDRYFLANGERRLETPQAFWMRVAIGLSLKEKDREKWAIKFYKNLSTLKFVSSTPTLFQAATTYPQLSSCYLTTISDDLVHIFKCLSDNAQLSKWSGGLGNDWSSLRATGALIKKTGVASQGVIPFLRIANDTTVAINRSGKRHGATCAYLETWHLDIEDFLDLRRNTGDERRRTHDMNTSNWIPDLFMKRVAADQDWTLFSPDETPDLHEIYGQKFEQAYTAYEDKAKQGEIKLFKTIKARDLWKKMITRLFETGHPWITWKDPCNIRSPQDHVGVIHSSNLCTEITLNTSPSETAVCNLGSVNLTKHIVNGKLDLEMLKETVLIAMRMLDNVIDINFYPTEEARHSNFKHRPVGLGIMGFQDALFMLNIPFASEAAVKFADESMEAVAYYAILGSSNLAAERGTYESYKGSKWDRGIFPQDTLALLEEERGMKIDVPRDERLDWSVVREAVRVNGMRNSNTMAIAPTATISNISGCFPGIEPIYKNLYVKSNMSGEFTVDNHFLKDDLKSLGLWSAELVEEIKAHDGSIQKIVGIPQSLKEKYKEAFEIDPRWSIKQAAYRGRWMDQSQSLNIFSASSSGKELSDIYMYAWQMGLKTTYYLRTLAASSIEKNTVDLKKQGNGHSAEEIMVSNDTVKTVSKENYTSDFGQGHFATVSVAPLESVAVSEKTVSVLEQKADGTVKIQVGEEIKLGKACLISDPECEACQ